MDDFHETARAVIGTAAASAVILGLWFLIEGVSAWIPS